MFSDLMRDSLTVKKLDGTEFPRLRGSVQGDKIFLMQTTPVVESGDEVFRHASNGTTERYVVLDPGFKEGLGSIPPHYQMKVRRWQAAERAMPAPTGFHVTINGPNARINHGSTDNSINVVNDHSGSAELIAELRKLIDQAGLPEAEREAAQEVASEIEDQFNSGRPRPRIVSALVNSLPSVATLAEAGVKLAALAAGVPAP